MSKASEYAKAVAAVRTNTPTLYTTTEVGAGNVFVGDNGDCVFYAEGVPALVCKAQDVPVLVEWLKETFDV